MIEKQNLKIVFMGTPEFAIPTLQAIYQSHHDLIAIYTKEPKIQGRGHKITKSITHEFAIANDISVYTPKTLKNLEDQQHLKKLAPDLIIVAAYGLILPSEILTIPKFGCINIHGSLLPKWRGAAPIHAAILSGDTKTGITLMQMDQGLDTGNIIKMQEILITPDDEFQSIHDSLANVGGQMICQLLKNIEMPIKNFPQDNSIATYANKIEKEDGLINWNNPSIKIINKIRAFSNYPGAYFIWNNIKIKILDATIAENIPSKMKSEKIKITKNNLFMSCEDNWLEIKKLQLENKKPILTKDFLNGYATNKKFFN